MILETGTNRRRDERIFPRRGPIGAGMGGYLTSPSCETRYAYIPPPKSNLPYPVDVGTGRRPQRAAKWCIILVKQRCSPFCVPLRSCRVVFF
eukprot:5198163-Pyramimonas_sp.AAC.1